jgi:hypothetical protein
VSCRFRLAMREAVPSLAWISQTRASQGGEVAVIGQFSGA